MFSYGSVIQTKRSTSRVAWSRIFRAYLKSARRLSNFDLKETLSSVSPNCSPIKYENVESIWTWNQSESSHPCSVFMGWMIGSIGYRNLLKKKLKKCPFLSQIAKHFSKKQGERSWEMKFWWRGRAQKESYFISYFLIIHDLFFWPKALPFVLRR